MATPTSKTRTTATKRKRGKQKQKQQQQQQTLALRSLVSVISCCILIWVHSGRSTCNLAYTGLDFFIIFHVNVGTHVLVYGFGQDLFLQTSYIQTFLYYTCGFVLYKKKLPLDLSSVIVNILLILKCLIQSHCKTTYSYTRT